MTVFNPSNFRGVQYRFEKEDKIFYRGFEYRFVRSNSQGVSLQRLGGDFPIEFFEHAAIGRMLAIGQLRVIRTNRSLPAAKQPAEDEETLSNLTGRIRADLRNRHIVVLAFQALLAEGLIKRTAKSIQANRLILDQRIYQIASERRKFDPSPSGSSSGVEAPAARHASTILRWERAYRRNGLAGLADRWWKSGNRGGYFTFEERELLQDCAAECCSIQRPSKAEIVDRTKTRFKAVNVSCCRFRGRLVKPAWPVSRSPLG